MSFRFSLILVFLSGLLSACNSQPKTAAYVQPVQTQNMGGDTFIIGNNAQLYSNERYKPCKNLDITQLVESAKSGDGQALVCLWDKLVYTPDTITLFNPQLVYEVYKIAKRKNPNIHIEEEDCKLTILQYCIEAGPLDWEALKKKYNVNTVPYQIPGFAVWEVAREASMGREFGKPDPHLVFQLACRGGNEMVDLDAVIIETYSNWKHNKVDTFDPLKYVYPDAYSSGGYHFFGYVRSIGEDDDAKWRVVTMASSLKNNAGVYLAGATDAATEFFDTKARGEEGNGGSGFGIWVSNSVNEQRTRYLDMVANINKGNLPTPFGGDDSSDAKLNTIYKKVTGYLKKEPITAMAVLSSEGITEAEKRWIPYRDSTAKMLAIIKPDVDESRWKKWLTEERSIQLWEAFKMAKELNAETGK